MLFYNHQREFIGIDEDGLKLLNYATLENLLDVCSDVADLFAKEPGYIHNFKSFNWIDFLLHADSDARSAIVHANGRTFSCTLSIRDLYLCVEPREHGYMIDMTHIQSISGDDTKPLVAPKVQEISRPIIEQDTPQPSFERVNDILPDYTHIIPTALSEPTPLELSPFDDNAFKSLDGSIEDSYPKSNFSRNDEIPQQNEVVSLSPAEKDFLEVLKVDKSYRFDPNVAARELGLPVDLIEEFIGDFIQQAYEFKSELFSAVLKADINNIKILSHKLKGVAANLRIEDALESLSTINTSNDLIEIEANLKYFYTIIAKLEGTENSIGTESSELVNSDAIKNVSTSVPVDDDIYVFAIKQDEPLPTPEESFDDFIDTPIEDETVHCDVEEAIPSSSPSLHYEKGMVAQELGIERDFFDEIIDEYKHDARIIAKDIVVAIGAFDTHAWKNSAAQLKGISDNLRLSEISEELAILSITNDAQEANKASKQLNNFLEQL